MSDIFCPNPVIYWLFTIPIKIRWRGRSRATNGHRDSGRNSAILCYQIPKKIQSFAMPKKTSTCLRPGTLPSALLRTGLTVTGKCPIHAEPVQGFIYRPYRTNKCFIKNKSCPSRYPVKSKSAYAPRSTLHALHIRVP